MSPLYLRSIVLISFIAGFVFTWQLGGPWAALLLYLPVGFLGLRVLIRIVPFLIHPPLVLRRSTTYLTTLDLTHAPKIDSQSNSQATSKEDVSPVELQDIPTLPQSQSPPKQGRWSLVFWIAVFYCITQTSWWGHQAWVGTLIDSLIRWATVLLAGGFLVLLWLPKPDANQPELLHVVPSDSSKSEMPSAHKSAS